MKFGLAFAATGIVAAVTLTTTAERGVAPALARSAAACSGSAGAVTKVVHTTAKLNNKYVAGPRSISAGDRLVTKKHAEINFCLKPGIDCTLHQKAGVRIKPPQTALLMRFNRGRMTCGTTIVSNPPLKEKILTAAGATLHIDDPLFVVVTTAATTTVKVVSGILAVGSDGTLTEAGPGQKVTVHAGEQPGDPQPLKPGDLTPAEQRDVTRLTPKVPQPDYSRPPVDNSSTLRRMYARSTVAVGVDTSAGAVEEGFRFATSYFKFLGGKWKLALQTTGIPATAATGALCGGSLDVYVTPQREALINAWNMPFFQSPSGQVWYLVGAGDATFHRALWAFFVGTLQAGDYGRIYTAQFGQTPSYALFDSLLDGPGKTPSPCIS